MKHYGVVHGRTSGYNNEVRKLLGQLKAFLDATNQKFGVRKELLEGGAEVRVSIIMNGAVPIYKAMVIPAEESTGQIIDSVFMESGFIQMVGAVTPVAANVWYTSELVADNSVTPISWLDWLNLETMTSISRVYTPGMTSLAMDTSSRMAEFVTGNFSTLSGKALLLWQASAGVSLITVEDYNGTP